MKMHAYLGDSVYAEWDGYYIVLRLNDPQNDSSKIALNPDVLNDLVEFRRIVRKETKTK